MSDGVIVLLRKLIAGSTAVALLSGCSANDALNQARTWCHDRDGYIANTGWYEWSCVINNTPIPLPSPKDKP